jgi:4-amino-4-deoxy-L-arabinose transferase-like glycosyltransferase
VTTATTDVAPDDIAPDVPRADPSGDYTTALRTAVVAFICVTTVVIVASYLAFLNAVIDYRVDQTGDAIAYLFLTRSLAETASYPSRHWSPGLPMLFAPIVHVVGIQLTVIKLGMVTVAFAAIGATFTWAKAIVGRLPAALVALAAASSPVFFDYSHRFLSEVPFTLFVLLFFCLVQTGFFEPGRASLFKYAAVAAVAMMVQLTRGNGVVLVPAVLLTAATANGHLRLGPWRKRAWAAALILALAVPTVVWNIRNTRRSYPGIHGSSYFDELRARSPMDLWKRGSTAQREEIPTSSLRDFGVRLYRNVAWGQIFNYPRAASYPVDLALRSSNGRTWLAVLAVVPVWAVLLIGVAGLYRRCPLAIWFTGLTMIVLVVWPWPWGADIRFITPVLPVLVLAFYMGLTTVAGGHWAAVLTMLTIAINIPLSVSRAIDQRRTPYASPEFANVLTLLDAAKSELRANEPLIIDPSIAGLGLVKAGRAAIDVEGAMGEIREGRSSALALVSTLTPEVTWRVETWIEQYPGALTVQAVRSAGETALVRIHVNERTSRLSQ